ncbi:MAG TPA: hypothetical protein VFG20_17530 [Planctomycetaceae bacterium]|nr:hypothetical protein [Planctomycetaceae bacterium]
MPDAPQSLRLLHGVARRLRFQAYVRAAYLSLIMTTIVYALVLLVSRLTGLIPNVFTWQSLAAIPLATALLALILHRRPEVRDAARAVDQVAGSKDLYLTLALLDRAVGDYHPLVVQDAEARAKKIEPQRVAPLTWQKRYWNALLLVAMTGGLIALPQFDPFGRVAASTLVSLRKDRLLESRKETQLRLAEVKKKIDEQEDNNDETPTAEAVDSLKLALNKMQPQHKQENLELLMDEQKQLTEAWKQLNADQLKNLLKAAKQAEQQFGSNQELLKKLTQDLQEGSLDGLKQEMQELQDELQKLAKTEDPVEKERLRREIKEKLKTLDEFAKKSLDSKPLNAALQRAMQQLDLAQLEEMSPEALEAALESLELSELELEELGQSAEDLKKLEEAMKAMQMAKKLNDKDKLDGKNTLGFKSMKEYEQFYKEMLAQAGQCDGSGDGNCPGCENCRGKKGKGGMKGPGTGEGGVAPENDAVKNEFQNEVAKSAVQAGKTLFSQKTQGLGEKGTVSENYRSLATQVKQGVSDALEQEQVPPGYHDGIKKYFDTLETPKK